MVTKYHLRVQVKNVAIHSLSNIRGTCRTHSRANILKHKLQYKKPHILLMRLFVLEIRHTALKQLLACFSTCASDPSLLSRVSTIMYS
jgi:hypothetical protein